MDNSEINLLSDPKGGMLKAYASKTLEEAIQLSNSIPTGMFFTSDTNDLVFNGRRYSGSDALQMEVRWNVPKGVFEFKINEFVPNGYIWLNRKRRRNSHCPEAYQRTRLAKIGWIPKSFYCNCISDPNNHFYKRVTKDMVGKWISLYDLYNDEYSFSMKDNEFYPANWYNVMEVTGNGSYKKVYVPLGFKYIIANPDYILNGIGKATPIFSEGELVTCKVVARRDANTRGVYLFGVVD